MILEAEPVYGGLCRSRTDEGFTFDTGGSHIIFSKDNEVLAFMRRMIAGNEQRNDRNTRIFYKQRFVKYPFENGLSELPKEDLFACINGFVKNLIAIEKGDGLLADRPLDRRFFPELRHNAVKSVTVHSSAVHVLAAGSRSSFDQHHIEALFGQKISGRTAGRTGAYYNRSRFFLCHIHHHAILVDVRDLLKNVRLYTSYLLRVFFSSSISIGTT